MYKIRKDLFKDNLYLIISFVCLILWAIYSLTYYNFNFNHWDFKHRYYAGKTLWENPTNLYRDNPLYFEFPAFASVFAISLSLLPLYLADFTYFIINVLLAILFNIEFNRVLRFMDVKNKKIRFIFLLIISNGFIIYRQFWLNNFKLIVGLILIFIIRRELQVREEDLVKNLKYHIINYGLFVFAICVFPPFVFLLLIYLFNDISFKDLFKLDNFKKYLIIISNFLLQNIIVLIYPSLIIDVFSLYLRFNKEWGPMLFFYLKEFRYYEEKNLLVTIMVIVLSLLTLMIILNKRWDIEYKFAYFCFFSIFINMYAWRTLVILVPFTLMVLVRFLQEHDKISEFLKTNKIIVIAMLSLVGLSMMPEYKFTFYKYAPMLATYPYYIILSLRWIFFVSILGISILILHLRYRHYIENDI